MSLPSLRLAAARHALGLTTSDELIATADALLDCGVYSYALGELGTARNAVMYDVEPLFLRALKEFNIPRPSAEEAAAIVVRHCIFNIAEEATSPLDALRQFFGTVYRPVMLDGCGTTIEPSPGGRELINLVNVYDDIEGFDYGSYLTPEEREQRLASLARRTRAFADDWTRAHFSGAIDPCWLTANDGLVASLAAAIKEEKRFQDLPVLADALEEAGCTEANLLAHCRDPGAHRERCWVLELMCSSGDGDDPSGR